MQKVLPEALCSHFTATVLVSKTGVHRNLHSRAWEQVMREHQGWEGAIARSRFDVAHCRLRAPEQIRHPLFDHTSEPHN